MRGVNKVILIGHLGKDPEVRHLDGNNVVANFPIATSESYTTKDGNRVEQTEWHNIVLWRKLAEIAEKYIKKGSLVFIEGRLRTRNWDDKDGNKRYITEVVGTSLQMLDKKGEGGSNGDSQTYSDNSSSSSNSSNSSDDIVLDEPNDDLPF
ncbi:MAG: single-stranded DNA-binding protein [Chitinophagales bacterium]